MRTETRTHTQTEGARTQHRARITIAGTQSKNTPTCCEDNEVFGVASGTLIGRRCTGVFATYDDGVADVDDEADGDADAEDEEEAIGFGFRADTADGS
jgi:hypothetical protein